MFHKKHVLHPDMTDKSQETTQFNTKKLKEGRHKNVKKSNPKKQHKCLSHWMESLYQFSLSVCSSDLLEGFPSVFETAKCYAS